MYNVVLLLGSNLGNAENNILLALSELEKRAGKIIKKTKISKTLPVEYDSDNVFCNIAVSMQTAHSPIKLLDEIKEIETEMGRIHDSKFFGEYRDRIIDIDIVSYEGLIFSCDRLKIPHHKHLYDRDFSRKLLDELAEEI
jgi:2-amino-4-hydroxy-6-hydroxymethyldihydropteridine diphosphokinase|nr:MAG TPA: 7,8-dihydro-6-hydroxymethylpterin-pyrophosphokinase [Caudoviricetes sp.]